MKDVVANNRSRFVGSSDSPTGRKGKFGPREFRSQQSHTDNPQCHLADLVTTSKSVSVSQVHVHLVLHTQAETEREHRDGVEKCNQIKFNLFLAHHPQCRCAKVDAQKDGHRHTQQPPQKPQSSTNNSCGQSNHPPLHTHTSLFLDGRFCVDPMSAHICRKWNRLAHGGPMPPLGCIITATSIALAGFEASAEWGLLMSSRLE